MADDKATIKSTYPIPAYNYRVTIQNDGQSTVMGFSEVSGLTVQYQPVYYKHGFSFAMGTKIIPGMRQPINITLKKGIIKGADYLSKWFHDVYANAQDLSMRDLLIDLCDETGNSVVQWKVQGALPTKLDGPSFNASTEEVAIESLELTAQDLQVNYSPG